MPVEARSTEKTELVQAQQLIPANNGSTNFFCNQLFCNQLFCVQFSTNFSANSFSTINFRHLFYANFGELFSANNFFYDQFSASFCTNFLRPIFYRFFCKQLAAACSMSRPSTPYAPKSLKTKRKQHHLPILTPADLLHPGYIHQISVIHLDN